MNAICEEKIEILVNRILVTGIAYSIDGWDIGVRIESPYAGYFEGRHVMLLARGGVSARVDKQNKFTESAIQEAQQILHHLYKKLKWLDDKADQVYEVMRRHFKSVISDFGGKLDEAWLKKERSWLRSLLKSGIIDAKTYQRKLKQAKAVHLNFKYSIIGDKYGHVKHEFKKSPADFLPEHMSYCFDELYLRKFRPDRSENTCAAK